VITHDIDLGAVEITAAWGEQQLARADSLSPAAARHARDAVRAYVEDIDLDDTQVDIAADDAEPGGGHTSAAQPEGGRARHDPA
jgi:hypothetical protein